MPFKNSQSTKRPPRSRCCKVFTTRAIFLTGLCVLAALLAYGAHRVISGSETALGKAQFNATADRALDEALEITLRKRLGVKSLATTVSYAFPDAEQWPFVHLAGFEEISGSVIDTAAAETMGVAPLVTEDELPEFVEYIHRVAMTDRGQDILPYQTWVTGFDEEFVRYNESGGRTWWNSTYDVMWPFSMHSTGTRILLFNLHSRSDLGRNIDEMHACAESRHKTEDLDLSACAILSDWRRMFLRDHTEVDPAAMIYQPIYPANDPNKLTGLITSALNWTGVLNSLFTKEVNGVDCVLATQSQAYTYHVKSGVVTLTGQGDPAALLLESLFS